MKLIDVDQEKVIRGQADSINVRYGNAHLHASRVEINGPCAVVSDPARPREFGARVWIETNSAVRVTTVSDEAVIA